MVAGWRIIAPARRAARTFSGPLGHDYETFEHTADLGLRVRAADLATLVRRGGTRPVFDHRARPDYGASARFVRFCRRRRRPTNLLLFDWLNELLYTYETRHLLLCEFDVKVSETGLQAVARGEPIDRDRHALEHEVKAITYHGLKLERERRRLAGGSDRGHLKRLELPARSKASPMAKDAYHGPLERVSDTTAGAFPSSYKPGMRVDGLIFADDALIEQIRNDQAPEQVANVAFLPGIQKASLAMPDIHWGYGFCIGGVVRDRSRRRAASSRPAASATTSTAASACCASNLVCARRQARIRPAGRRALPRHPDRRRPARASIASTRKELQQPAGRRRRRTSSSAAWRPTATSSTPRPAAGSTAPTPTASATGRSTRGADQCGTLGSGNHFLEVQVVDRVFDDEAAARHGPAQRTGLRDDPLAARAAWATRSATTPCAILRKAPREVRHRPARPAARLRPGRQPRGPALPRRHARRGQLRLVQSPAPDAAGPRGLRNGLRPLVGRAAA